MQKFRIIYLKFKNAYIKVSAKRYSTLAGTLVFFLLLSIIPFIYITTLLFNMFNVSFDWILQLDMLSDYQKVIGIFLDLAKSATSGTSIFFIISAIYSSTTFFYHMRRSGEIIYNYERKKGGVLIRFSAAVFVIIIMFIGVIFGGIFVAFQVTYEHILPSIFYRILVYIGVLGLAYFIIMLLNLYICPYKNKLKNTVNGSLFTLIFWTAAFILFTLYINYLSNFEKLYGAFAFIIIFIFWLYILMQGLIIGVILNMKDTIVKKDKSY